MHRTTKRNTRRILIAALVITPLALGSFSPVSFAAPSKGQVDAAKAKLAQLEEKFESAVEDYNEARSDLTAIQARLAQAKGEMTDAQGEADEATAQLEERAVEAYTGAGSKIDVLLGAESFNEFSDRLEYMGAIARNDADIAATASAARQRASWAAERFEQERQAQEKKLAQVKDHRDEIDSLIDEQQGLVDRLGREYAAYQRRLAAQREAAQRLAEQEQEQPGGGGGDLPPGGGGGGGGGGTTPPPPSSPGGLGAAQAAQAMVGKPYVWASSNPSVGFDCSGLTSYAWSRVGVSLPHSSRAQYASLPRVGSLSQAQPGDLVFFYSDIHHVGIYVGGGGMVHASSTNGKVVYQGVSSYGAPLMGIRRPG